MTGHLRKSLQHERERQKQAGKKQLRGKSDHCRKQKKTSPKWQISLEIRDDITAMKQDGYKKYLENKKELSEISTEKSSTKLEDKVETKIS